MPIYEYACKKCAGEFEVSQRITDATFKRYLCPHCGKRTPVTKLISRSSFHLKGSGWYVTDYGKNGEKSPKSDDTKSGDTTNSDTKSGDTKSGDAKSGDAKSGDAKGRTEDSSSSSSSSKKESSSETTGASKSTNSSAS